MALRAVEIWLLMVVWLGWNYTPLHRSWLRCHFLSSPGVILPRAAWFIERLHCNSYMVEGPMAQITQGCYVLKACPPQCNKTCHCTHEQLPSLGVSFSLMPFLMPRIHEHGFVRGQVSNQYFSFQFAHCCQHLPLAWSSHSCSIKMLQLGFFFTCNMTFLHFLQWSELPLATEPSILSPHLFVLMFTQHGIVVDVDWMRLIR